MIFSSLFAPRLARAEIATCHLHGVPHQEAALAQFQGRSQVTGKEFKVNTAHVCTLANGKVVRFQAFHDIAGLSEALGLPGREAQRLAA